MSETRENIREAIRAHVLKIKTGMKLSNDSIAIALRELAEEFAHRRD